MRKLLLVSIFCAGFLNQSIAQNKRICEGFEANFEVTKKNPVDKVSDIEFTVIGTNESVKCIFFKESGHLVSNDLDKLIYTGVEPGKYRAVVVTVSGCRVELQIIIE